jgi:hypothetical protein
MRKVFAFERPNMFAVIFGNHGYLHPVAGQRRSRERHLFRVIESQCARSRAADHDTIITARVDKSRANGGLSST